MSEDWFILRTSGRFTLQLAASLAEDGFDVWTPARTQTIRIPRANVRRPVTFPMLPSFVFARARHLHDLLTLEKMPVKHRKNVPEPEEGEKRESRTHRDFSVFRYLESIPTVTDRHLEPLREAEKRAIPKKARPGFEKGQGVRVNKGPFEGLIGKVKRCKSGYALVIFTSGHPVQIPTFLLEQVEAISLNSSSGPLVPSRKAA